MPAALRDPLRCPLSSLSSRRGQGNANSAAILVALIGAILIAYILTMPPEYRDQLLQGGDRGSNGRWSGGMRGGGGGYGPVLILAESPGSLRLQASPQVEHSLPSTTVFTTVNTVAVQEVSSLYVKNSLFQQQGGALQFDADLRTGRNYLLTFNVDKARGNLLVTLNGHVIYNNIVTEKSPQPIALPPQYLQHGTNDVQFFVGDVGLRFWAKNEYLLRNVQVAGDLLDFRGAQSEQHFTLPEQEYAQLEVAALSMVPDCDPRSAGRLIIEVNGHMIFSGYADCGVLNRLDISKELLAPGDNSIVFVSDQGSYLLDRIRITSHLIEQEYPLYYFNLPLEFFEPIEAGDNELLLTLRFSDYRDQKRGEVVINGFVQSFGTNDYVYQAVLDPGILMPGPNTIQILPHVNRLNVAELKIEMI